SEPFGFDWPAPRQIVDFRARAALGLAHTNKIALFCFANTLKLIQKSNVVLVEKANVVDLVTDHGDAFDAEAEGPAAPDFGIVADIFKNFRMHHAAARNLHPIFAKSFD